MSKNIKAGIISLMGVLGVIALFIGIFTKLYSFNVGLVIALAFWMLMGVVATFLGVKR